MKLKLQVAEPSEIYKPYIKYYKYVESDIAGTMKVVPICHEELYFNFTNVRLVSPGIFNLENPRVHLAGLIEYDQVARSTGDGSGRGGGFAVVFRPMGFYNLFSIRSKDFFRYAVNCELILKNEVLNLWEQLYSKHNVIEMKFIFERYLMRYAKQSCGNPCLLNSIFNYIDTGDGMIRISRLCEIFNISARSLQRYFRNEIGITPKGLLHIYRINKALRMINHKQDCDLSDISYLSGYYDQSHFIRDIKKITGITPGQIMDKKDPGLETVDNIIFIREN